VTNRQLARGLAVMSILSLIGGALAFAGGLITAASDNEPEAIAALIAAIILMIASYLLRAWGRWLVGLSPFREEWPS
jgi:ABC-type Mn2+/Zn2+ transport system permease subunit